MDSDRSTEERILFAREREALKVRNAAFDALMPAYRTYAQNNRELSDRFNAADDAWKEARAAYFALIKA